MRDLVAAAGIGDLLRFRRRARGTAGSSLVVSLGMRWPVERTNSWLSSYAQLLRGNTDRRISIGSRNLPSRLLITACRCDNC